ncbi:MAG: PEP-CTERM sorting domain-containing protein [Pirellulales bacterium]|nr:PEP-CTERM sorting domain-containing protein [Pirellulales bacterium]
MKSFYISLVAVAFLIVLTPLAEAAVIDGVNWADDAYAYSASIQNFGGTKMSEDAAYEAWVVGPPDADANDNGYAWDEGDPDYVAGWRANAPSEYLVVYFDAGLADVEGGDLTVWFYCGPDAEGMLSASTDGSDYVNVGSFGGGESGYLQGESFDFDGLFEGSVHYVKVARETNGKDTGMFFDAFGGTAVPEPATAVLLSAAGLIGLLAYAVRKRK